MRPMALAPHQLGPSPVRGGGDVLFCLFGSWGELSSTHRRLDTHTHPSDSLQKTLFGASSRLRGRARAGLERDVCVCVCVCV